MVGFTRTAPHSSNAKLGTGISALDGIVCVQPGTVTAIYEHENSFIHTVMLAIATSNSLDNIQQPTYVLALENKLLFRFNKHLQSVDTADRSNSKLTIAWRYADLGTNSAPFQWNLNLKTPLGADHIISSLEDALSAMKIKKGCIFIIYSLFSPLYGVYEAAAAQSILYLIRKWSKVNDHVVFLSIPCFLLPYECSVFFDNIVEIEALLTMTHEKAAYNSILTIKKRSPVGILDVKSLDSFKYGIRLTSKNFKIEKIDIPPEEAPTQATSPCGINF